MAGGQGKLAFNGQDFQAVGRSHHVPESRLARRGGDADARRPAVNIVGHVGGLGVASQRPDSANLGLRHQRMVSEIEIPEQRLQRPLAPAEA